MSTPGALTPLPDPLITHSPDVLSGAVVFAGRRSAAGATGLPGRGDPLDEFLEDFPTVTREHAIAVLELAAQALAGRATAA